MKLMKKKKGFTIVELVIVIAVIAVLAAVLIPTFINLTNKANKAADDSLVTSLNKALAIEEVDHDVNNMHDAVECLKREGYIASALVTKSDQKLLYSLEENRFLLEEDKNEGVYQGTPDYKFWTIQDSYDSSKQQYSIYAADNFSTATVADLKVGFDAGDSDTVTSISYVGNGESEQKVIIRTNGGTLTVNAPYDTAKHFGDGEVLTISSIAGNSYHEYGYFPKASIAQGRIVVENSGDIPSFQITAIPTEENPVKIETKKDVVVSATPEVVAALGENKLDYVDIKVTSTTAKVIVDEKIETTNVEINGHTATEDDVVSITKVSNLTELQSALAGAKPYIMFASDITANSFTNIIYSVTIDGDGHKISGTGGIRTGSTYDILAINWQQSNNQIDVAIKNLKGTNTRTSGVARVVETRASGLKSLEISNCVFESKSYGNDGNPLCIGGTTTDVLKVKISDSQFLTTTSAYACLIWVPIDAELTDAYFEGYGDLYFKSGSKGSNVKLNNSTLSAPNVHSGQTNSFGAIVFEEKNIRITLTDSSINVTGPGQSTQTGVLFSAYWGDVKDAGVFFKGNCEVNGLISSPYFDPTNFVSIEGGTYTFDPSAYVASGHIVKNDGSFYTVI